jgi:predicted kinase
VTELILPDPCVVLLVGAAGSGKSTFAARHFPGDAVLSSDALRELIGGDAADQRATRPAFAALHLALDRRLREGHLAVVDATNITAASRRSIRRIAARWGAPVVAIVLDLPEHLVRSRNAGRLGRVVPADVVTRHLESLAVALRPGGLDAEGYAAVVRLTDPRDVEELGVRVAPGVPPAQTGFA